jgi:hypothetical protein
VKKLFSALSIFFSVLSLSAQETDLVTSLFSDSAKTKNTILFTSDFLFASNAITNELAKEYFLNGFITDEMKDGVTKKLDDKNRLGGDFSFELYFRHKPDSMFGSRNWSWYIGIKNTDHINSTFPRDLFEVYFRGNKNYAGETADFSGFNYLLVKYQQLQFGLSKSYKTTTARYEAGAAIGFNMGQQLFRIEASRATLYTEEIGEYLDVNTGIEIHTSDSLHKNFGSFNGFGLSTDLFFKGSINKKHFFSARISNLGFIKWNSQSAEVRSDTSFRFEGIEVTKLFDLFDTVTTSITTDSGVIQSFLTNRKYSSYTLLLPAKIEVAYRMITGNHTRTGLGANYILHADYKLQFLLDFDYSWKKNLVGVNVSYGGYTTFGTGLYYRRHFKHGYVLMIGSNYINTLFNLDKGTAENIHLTLYRNF